MFFRFWHDGKFDISSFKSAMLLAGFLRQQFCFLRRKIRFFHFDCKQVGDCPQIQTRLCTHTNRRWCRINSKSRSSRETIKNQSSQHILAIVPDDWALPDFSDRSNLNMRSWRLFRNWSVLLISLVLDNQVETITVWNVKKTAKLWKNLSLLDKAMDVEVTSTALANLPSL